MTSSSTDRVRDQKWYRRNRNTRPEVIKLFPCSTQLSTKFILLINVKMPTTVGILTFISSVVRLLDFQNRSSKIIGQEVWIDDRL